MWSQKCLSSNHTHTPCLYNCGQLCSWQQWRPCGVSMLAHLSPGALLLLFQTLGILRIHLLIPPLRQEERGYPTYTLCTSKCHQWSRPVSVAAVSPPWLGLLLPEGHLLSSVQMAASLVSPPPTAENPEAPKLAGPHTIHMGLVHCQGLLRHPFLL